MGCPGGGPRGRKVEKKKKKSERKKKKRMKGRKKRISDDDCSLVSLRFVFFQRNVIMVEDWMGVGGYMDNGATNSTKGEGPDLKRFVRGPSPTI